MAVGANGGGSARSRVTGQRGGDGRNTSRGRGRAEIQEDEDEEYNGEGGDEGQEESDDEGQNDVDVTFGRAKRTICDGDYKKKPDKGQPKLGVVHFIKNANIKEARYKKTLKAIVRNRWDYDTARQNRQAREIFLNQCITEFKEIVDRTSEEGSSQDASSQDATLSPSIQRKRDVQLLLEACPPKKGKLLMFPRHTLRELVGMEEAAKYTTSQSTLACIPERIPESAYSIIGKVMTEVTNMVEAIQENEVTRARLDEEVHKLVTLAYPNRGDPASKVLWEEYIRIAAQMTAPLFERNKKVILEVAELENARMDLGEDFDLHDLETRYPL